MKNIIIPFFVRLILVFVVWAVTDISCAFGQQNHYKPHLADSVFKKRMPVVLHVPGAEQENIEPPVQAKKYIQLTDQNRRYLFPDNVKIKVKVGKKGSDINYTKEGRTEFDFDQDWSDQVKIKVVVGKHVTSNGKFKRKVQYLPVWEASLKGILIPVGKQRNFLGLKAVCPKI